MKRQKSYQNEREAALYLIPTPIGNLDDMTFRAVNLLKAVDVIACEDTRHTKKLCSHFGIHTSLVSYHEHNKEAAGLTILNQLLQGKQIAVVSDAGMPAISDPGYELVAAAIAEGIKVIALPGANAALTALTASGLVPQPFYFYGFLNRQAAARKQALDTLKSLTATLIFYESPHRLKEMLQALQSCFGDREVVIARELSKKFEEYIRGQLSEINALMQDEELRGEFVVIVAGESMEGSRQEAEWWSKLSIFEHVEWYIEHEACKNSEAIKMVSKDRGVKKQEIYRVYHEA